MSAASASRLPGKNFAPALAKRRTSVYRRAYFQTMVRSAKPLAKGFAGLLTVLVEQSNGRTETKNLSVQARHAPFGRCAEGSDLCRGQELRRNAPPAPYRPEDRHVSRPPGSAAGGKRSR